MITKNLAFSPIIEKEPSSTEEKNLHENSQDPAFMTEQIDESDNEIIKLNSSYDVLQTAENPKKKKKKNYILL